MDAAESKHVVLGLIFLKYISDAFEKSTPNSTLSASRASPPRTPTSTARPASSGSPRRPRENVRAHLRVLVKRILRKHGYPPDKQERATQAVLEQAEVLSAEWAA
jgi:type I restriction enzyme R subunit